MRSKNTAAVPVEFFRTPPTLVDCVYDYLLTSMSMKQINQNWKYVHRLVAISYDIVYDGSYYIALACLVLLFEKEKKIIYCLILNLFGMDKRFKIDFFF